MDYERFYSRVGRQVRESAIRRMGAADDDRRDVVSFAPGYPDPTLFPWDDLRDIAGQLLSGQEPSILQYGPPRGLAPLREATVGLLAARGIAVTADELLITTGTQQAVDLLARVLVEPGDVVLTELATFTGSLTAFRNAGAELVGLPVEHDGIDLDALDLAWSCALAGGRPVKLLYLIPNFQNPTGTLLSRDKRARLIAWAEYHDVLIVEDDPYGSLYFDDETAPDTRPLRADCDTGRVIYTSSFSKVLAPGLRVAWVTAPSALIDRLENAKQSADLTCGGLDQHLAYEALRRGVIDRVLPSLRARYRSKRDIMEAAMCREIGERLAWGSPRGGFFIWARLPHGCMDVELLTRAQAEGVTFVVGSAFHVDGSGHDTIRLSFSEPSADRIDEGIRRLSRALTPAAAGS
jgi:2-aminoadipate transaminase